MITRGEIEDTRLEAKAKDTKKIRGQGQTFRGQTLSRLRTGMLEAKAKGQGHKRECSQKKVFKKFFQPIYKILTTQKIVLSSSRGQGNFRGIEALRSRPKTWPLRPRPRTSKRVLEDSTSGDYALFLHVTALGIDLNSIVNAKHFKTLVLSKGLSNWPCNANQS